MLSGRILRRGRAERVALFSFGYIKKIGSEECSAGGVDTNKQTNREMNKILIRSRKVRSRIYECQLTRDG
jgi:hypothetical protein